MYRYCLPRLGNDYTLTEETVNDIMTVLFEKWDTIDLEENIRAYLYRVADNCIRYTLRKHNKYYHHNESYEEALENSRLDVGEQMDEYFCSEATDEEYMWRIRDALPEEYRELFVLRYVEKKTICDISRITGIPYSSLRLRLRKTEDCVRNEIKQIFE